MRFDDFDPTSIGPERMIGPNERLARDKYEVCLGIAIDEYSSNVHAMAELLYKSLYDPSYFLNPEVTEKYRHPHYADRLDILSGVIEPAKETPDEGTFFGQIRDVVTRELDIESTLLPESIRTLKGFMEKGKVIVWTQGDTVGSPEHPGSSTQLKKVALAGLGDLRREVSRTQNAEIPSGQATLKPSDLLSVVSAEDKMSDEIIGELRQLTTNHVVVSLDDKLENLVRLQTAVPSVIPIWVRQDEKYRDLIPESLSGINLDTLILMFNAINGIEGASDKVDQVLEGADKPPIFLVDFDGTLTDNTRKKQIQEQAVINKLRDLGWI